MLFAITYWSGLKPVVLEDVRERIGQIRLVRTIIGERHDAVILDYAGAPAKLLGLRSIQGAFALGDYFEGVKVARSKGLLRIAEICRSCSFSEAVAGVGSTRGAAKGTKPSFALTVNVIGHHTFGQGDIHAIVLDWLQEGMGWSYCPSGAELTVRFQLNRDEGFLGLALASKQMRKRAYKVSTRPGSLDPTVAYCVARLTQPEPDDVFLDPMCGAGTIAIERALGWPASKVICGDIAQSAVEATRRNARAACAEVCVHHWDATCLPIADASVDKVAMNMPYGKDIPLSGPKALISNALEETARVMRKGGRLVVLSAHGHIITRWLRRRGPFRCQTRSRLPLYGFDAWLLVLERR